MKKRIDSFYSKVIKRALDIICSLLAIVCFGWLYIIVAVLVRIKLGAPVIYSTKRVGKNGKVFTLYKFRSMSNARGSDGNLLPDTDRLTKFGRIIRATSLA